MDLVRGQIERGHDVSLIYSGHRLDESFSRRASCTERLRTHQVDMRRAPHVSDAIVVSRIRKYIRSHGPVDFVHAHSSKAGAVARMLWFGRPVPIIYTPHCMYTMNDEAGRLAFRLTRALERLLAKRTDAIIAVSPEEREHILTLGIPAEKVHCVINGVTSTAWQHRAAVRRQLGLPQHEVVVGYLGRLSQQKNPLLLLEAIARLADLPHVHLAVAGTGELDEAVRSMALRLGIAQRIHWLGYLSAEEVLPAFDVFALPSSYEGMPYVLLEAVSAGLPVVATDVGGARQVVHEGENGFVVPRSSPDDLANALRKLAESSALRGRFEAASRNLAMRFTIDEMVDQTLAVYETARLSSRTAARRMEIEMVTAGLSHAKLPSRRLT
jgi:glycosyltransferase involved in cell wall biosynthesis